MNAVRRTPLFVAGLALCGSALLGEVWWLRDARAGARAAAEAVVALQTERRTLETLSPAPSAANAEAIERTLADTRRTLAGLMATLGGGWGNARRGAKIPATRAEAYFDIAGFVERTRELAQEHAMEIRPEAARFGFAAYSNGGPEEAHREQVFKQRQIVEQLLAALVRARPRALLEVKREPPADSAERGGRHLTEAGDLAAPAAQRRARAEVGRDFFALDSRLRVQASGFAHTLAFRLSFVGQTSTLRTFLQELGRLEMPLFVREIAVEPSTIGGATQRASRARSDRVAPASYVLGNDERQAAVNTSEDDSDAVPLIAQPWSQFVVTIECVELLPVAALAAGSL